MRLRTAGEIRWLGLLLSSLGAVLLVAMSAISLVYASLVFAPQKSGSTGVRFTGSKADIVFAFGIFAVVLTIGLLSTSAGVWQIIFGRRNRVLLWLGIALGFALLIGGELLLALIQIM